MVPSRNHRYAVCGCTPLRRAHPWRSPPGTPDTRCTSPPARRCMHRWPRTGCGPSAPADAFYEIYAEDLEPELARLRPDLVIHEWGLPGAAVAAQRAGIPGIWHGFGRMIPEGIGLELPTKNAEVPGRPHLDICPPSLQDKDFLATEHRIELRPVPFSTPAALPAWDGQRTSRPLIYLTLGTAFGTPELLRTAIAGLATLDARVVVAAGRVPPDQLGEVPDQRHRAELGAAGGPAAARRRGRAPRRQRHHPRRARGRRTATDPAPGRRPVRQRRGGQRRRRRAAPAPRAR